MKPVPFDQATAVLAEDQDVYRQLPIEWVPEHEGQMISCWELSEDELEEVLRQRKIWLSVSTFGEPMQPVSLATRRKELLVE
jgi:hypothetical protein